MIEHVTLHVRRFFLAVLLQCLVGVIGSKASIGVETAALLGCCLSFMSLVSKYDIAACRMTNTGWRMQDEGHSTRYIHNANAGSSVS